MSDLHYCVDVGGDVAYDVDLNPNFGVLQAIALHSKMWPQFAQISISFLGGTRQQQQLVRDVVNSEFVPLVNLRIRFVDRRGDIRVSFEREGSWSLLGTDARLANRSHATMNLGWLDEPQVSHLDASDPDYKNYGVIKHEFGHALGAFLHEHSHPDRGYDWNEEVVASALSGPPNFWGPSAIRVNMFERYAHSEIRSTDYDRESIMHYFFPAEWTTTGVDLKANQDMSEQDKYFLRMEYPPRVNLPIELRDTTTPPQLLYAQSEPNITVEKDCNSDKTLLLMIFVALFLAVLGFLLGRKQQE